MKRKTAALFLIGILVALGLIYFVFTKPSEVLNSRISIQIISFAKIVKAGQDFKITWHIASSKEKKVDQTAVYFGKNSNVSPQGSSAYPFNGEALTGEAPDDFAEAITLPKPGIYFARALVVIGGMNYWSDEIIIQAK